jgi:uncharacterized protein involved in tellurium resistance
VGFFDRNKGGTITETAPAVQASPDGQTAGKVSLAKGQVVSLAKAGQGGADAIIVRNVWTARGKDYDLKALVLFRDGRSVYVGAANSDEVLTVANGAVTHSGDSTSADKPETLTIKWSPEIERIAVSSYSALENGSGSFKKYGVSVEIANGQQSIAIPAADANADGRSYTLCFGEIVFGTTPGAMKVTALEDYSKRDSERRVAYVGNQVKMDAGPEGQRKK